MSRIKWKTHLRAQILPPDHVFLLSEQGCEILKGKGYVAVATHLDGTCSFEEVVVSSELHGTSRAEAQIILHYLQASGWTCDIDVEQSSGFNPEEIAYWHALNLDALTIRGCLSERRLRVISSGGADADPLKAALQALHCHLDDDGDDDHLLIVVATDYLAPELEAINRVRLERGGAWALVRLVGTVIRVGPFFVPYQTGCLECMAHRLRMHREIETSIEAWRGGHVQPPLPRTRWSVQLGAEFAAIEILRWLTQYSSDTDRDGRLLTFDLKSNAIASHRLVRRPQCCSCGVSTQFVYRGADHENIAIPSSPKSGIGDGRGLSAEAVLESFGYHVSPYTGVVRKLFELEEGLDTRVVAAQPFPMHRYDFRVLRDNLTGRSGGKGSDASEAKATALCEALERYSGIWQGEEEEIYAGTRTGLKGEIVDVETCLGFSAQQYNDRDKWNASNDDPHVWVPNPLDPDLVIDWTPVWSLTHSRRVLAPAAYSYFGHPDLRLTFCGADSNGCAAGATLTEAAVFGMLELIERDAAAAWWYNRARRPAVDFESYELTTVSELQANYRRLGREVWALDLTSDLGVPVFAAISSRNDYAVEDIIFGFGAHFDPAIALIRAVLEMHQSYHAVACTEVGAATQYRTDRPATRRWFKRATRASEPYLLPDPCQQPKTRSDYSWPKQDYWRDDLLECVRRFDNAGLETLILDQTRPDIGLPVCRVIVPGVCHLWRRFGTKRLYDLPVQLGWLDAPRAEEDLNPWCIYF
jgi:ribosomal protein S12 methylthiotransferase accessory factor